MNVDKLMFWKKCEFTRVCPKYNVESVTCNQYGGAYHSDGGPAGCYIEMENLRCGGVKNE